MKAMESAGTDRRIAGIAALDQPLRRDLYRLLGERDWVTRDLAAAELDVPRSVAAFHLDKLVDAGVAEVRFERTSGKQGPGAGRPSKLYRRVERELAASIPERSYDLAGLMLSTAISEATETRKPVDEALTATACAFGHELGELAAGGVEDVAPDADRRDSVMAVLAEHGYEPARDGDDIVLRNCPFHRLAEAHRALVCGMNRDFLGGVLDGFGSEEALDARLDPQPGFCCVRITAA
jgi:predicted ArsR family transcriptional regulator